jgi:uracil-DNA glycosylase
MVRPVVHGPAIPSRILIVGQAPGPREGSFGRPFAWTAGKTLFGWLHGAIGADEATVRERVYFSAVARCFPGKAKGGGDRKPDETEILACRKWLQAEAEILAPELVLPVGGLAIAQVLGHAGKLDAIVGTKKRATWHGVACDVIALPHPSGASTWHRTEPGKTLLARALRLVGEHPSVKATFR